MADVHTAEQRRRNMQAIRNRDTKPELVLRTSLHSLGYRYRLHVRNLPGSPDLVFPSRNKVMFVHGCYWHVHTCRYGRVAPKTNAAFWRTKRLGNVERDRRQRRELRRMGWQVFLAWECQIRKKPDWVVDRAVAFLEA